MTRSPSSAGPLDAVPDSSDSAELAVTALLSPGRGQAQGATPTTTPLSGRDLLLQASIAELPAGPVTLEFIRITLAPGAASPPHAHSGPEFGVVEAGTLTVRVETPAVLLPAAGDTATGSTVTPVGEEFPVARGDRIAYPTGTTLTFRNAGEEPVSLLAVTILPAGEEAPPGVIWADGPPAPDDTVGVTSQLLGRAAVTELPASPVAVTLERFVLSAGDQIAAYPGPVLVSVEAGSLTGSVTEGEVEVAQAGTASGEANATPGAEFAVTTNEALFFPRGMSETPPLSGDGSLTILRLGILDLPAAAAEEDAGAAPAEGAAESEAGATVVVAYSDVNLRAGPSTGSATIAVLQPGQVLEVTGPAEEGDGRLWLPVRDPADPSLSGYVAAEFLTPQP